MSEERSFFRWLWESITEPRKLRTVYFFVYVVTFVTGLAVLSEPPRELTYSLEELVPLLGVPMTLGGIFGAVAVLPGWWWVERLGILLASGAILIYAVSVIWVTARTEFPAVSTLGMLALTAAVYVVRWIGTAHYRYEPRR